MVRPGGCWSPERWYGATPNSLAGWRQRCSLRYWETVLECYHISAVHGLLWKAFCFFRDAHKKMSCWDGTGTVHLRKQAFLVAFAIHESMDFTNTISRNRSPHVLATRWFVDVHCLEAIWGTSAAQLDIRVWSTRNHFDGDTHSVRVDTNLGWWIQLGLGSRNQGMPSSLATSARWWIAGPWFGRSGSSCTPELLVAGEDLPIAFWILPQSNTLQPQNMIKMYKDLPLKIIHKSNPTNMCHKHLLVRLLFVELFVIIICLFSVTFGLVLLGLQPVQPCWDSQRLQNMISLRKHAAAQRKASLTSEQ